MYRILGIRMLVTISNPLINVEKSEQSRYILAVHYRLFDHLTKLIGMHQK